MARGPRLLVLFLVLTIVGAALVNLYGVRSLGTRVSDISFSQFYREVEGGNVASVRFQERHLQGSLRNGQRFNVRVFNADHPGMANLIGELRANDVQFWVDPPSRANSIVALLSVLAFPLMILALIYFLVLRPAQSSAPAVRLPTSIWEVHRELLGLRQEVADLQVAVQHLEDELSSRPKS